MKKVAISLIILSMLLAMTACSGTPATTTTASTTKAATTTVAPAATTAAGTTATTAAGAYSLLTTGIGTKISSSVKAAKKYKIAVIIKNTTNPYMIKIGAGAEKAAKDMGFEVKVMAPAQQDSVEEQVSIMESTMQQGIDAFVVVPVDSRGIDPAVKKANEKKIPMAGIGTVPTEPIMLRSGVDYTQTGVLVADYLAKAIGGKGGVVILEGPPGAQNAEERKNGILQTVKKYPDLKVLASQTANFKRAEGMQVMENLLQRSDVKNDLKMVVACNDEMAIGAIQALKAAGLKDKVLVGGFDGSKDASTAIKDGDLAVSYNTDPYGSTYLACAYLVQFLNDGKKPPEYFIPFPAERDKPLITKDNIADYIANIAWWQ